MEDFFPSASAVPNSPVWMEQGTRGELSSCCEAAQHLDQGEEPLRQAVIHVTEVLLANLFSGVNPLTSAWEAALVRTGGFLLPVHFLLLLAFAVLSKCFCPWGFVPKNRGVGCSCILPPVCGIMDHFVQQGLFDGLHGPLSPVTS